MYYTPRGQGRVLPCSLKTGKIEMESWCIVAKRILDCYASDFEKFTRQDLL